VRTLPACHVPPEVGGDGRFVVPHRVPAYLRAWEEGQLGEKVARALETLRPCHVCPRPCRPVDRLSGEIGGCRTGRYARVVSAGPHRGEEDVLRGDAGSGTIFFSGCNLRCVFCQNWDLSQRPAGRECPPTELARLMVRLQDAGCHNINLVTPEHVVPQVLEALPYAVAAGLRLPLVYNTSAYDGPDTIDLLDGVVDVYMPDFKLWDARRCRCYLGVEEYAAVARDAIRRMHEQVGVLTVDADGLAVRGLLVRHLVLPGLIDDTRAILAFLAALSPDTYVNVMDQYRPDWRVPGNPRYAAIDRGTSRAEWSQALALAREAGVWRLDARWRPMSRRKGQ
jgi:putative pyruvate formate lyase activating enzyme